MDNLKFKVIVNVSNLNDLKSSIYKQILNKNSILCIRGIINPEEIKNLVKFKPLTLFLNITTNKFMKSINIGIEIIWGCKSEKRNEKNGNSLISYPIDSAGKTLDGLQKSTLKNSV